jgi:AcrR family transcriptional regulator
LPTALDHEADRSDIIESAVALFASKGFAEATTSDICRAAGISTGSLFHYFPSKQAVFYGIWELDRNEWD